MILLGSISVGPQVYPMKRAVEMDNQEGTALVAVKENTSAPPILQELSEGSPLETDLSTRTITDKPTNVFSVLARLNADSFSMLPREVRMYIIYLVLDSSLNYAFEDFFDIGCYKMERELLSIDRKVILIKEHNHPVTLWDAKSGEKLKVLEGTTHAVSLACSFDSKNVITGSWVFNALTGKSILEVEVWDISAGNERSHVELLGSEEESYVHVRSLLLSPCGSVFLTARAVVEKAPSVLHLWETTTGRQLVKLGEGLSSLVGFSPDGTIVFGAAKKNTVYLWDIKTGCLLHALKGHRKTITAVAFSPSGHQVLVASGEKIVRLWDTKTGQQLHVYEGHEDYIKAVAFSPDGKTVLTGSYDATARLWNVVTEEQLMILTQGVAADNRAADIISVDVVAFSADGATLITGTSSGCVSLWDAKNGKFLVELSIGGLCDFHFLAGSLDENAIFALEPLDGAFGWKRSGHASDWLTTRPESAYEIFKKLSPLLSLEWQEIQ